MSDRIDNEEVRAAFAAVLKLPWRLFQWCFRSKARFAGVALLIFGSLVGGSYGAYGYWASPTFCHSCHIMDPYYDSWQISSHKDVACVACHFEPGIENELRGKWVAIKQLASTVTGAYSSMPYAEVSDSSCMRSGCHSPEQLALPVEFSSRGVKFDHSSHLGEMRRGIKLACTSCHHQRLFDTHIELDKGTCFLCHFKQAESEGHSIGDCNTCHGPPKDILEVAGMQIDHASFIERGMACAQCHVELKSGTGAVGKERCYSCHNDPEQIAEFGNSGLLHVEHVTTHKLHCYQCHNTIEHRMDVQAELRSQQECLSCHGSSHGKQADLYAGRGAKGVAAMPDPMHSLGLDCVGCHGDGADLMTADWVHAQDSGSGSRSCSTCHSDRYSEYLPALIEGLGEMSSHLRARLAVIQTRISAALDAGQFIDRALYRAATQTEHNLGFLAQAGAMHNPLYSVEILRAGRAAIEAAEAALDISATDDDLPFGFEVEDCGICHDNLPLPGMLSLSADRSYPHDLHLEETGMDCADCHQGETHPPRAATSKSACAVCHQE